MAASGPAAPRDSSILRWAVGPRRSHLAALRGDARCSLLTIWPKASFARPSPIYFTVSKSRAESQESALGSLGEPNWRRRTDQVNITTMKQVSTLTVTCGILAAAAIISILPVQSQNVPVAGIEQYQILSSRIPATNQPKTDEQIARELNSLGAQGWKVRAANQNAIILAR